MTGIIEIIGLIASVLELCRSLRNLITGIYEGASNSFAQTSGCFRFVTFLIIVEEILKSYMKPAWKDVPGISDIVEAVREELLNAWIFVTDFKITNRWLGSWKKYGFRKNLRKSEEAIRGFLKLLKLIAIASLPQKTQDGHAHSGNEDLDLGIALSLSLEEQRKANSRGGSSEVDDDELARAVQASLDIGSLPRSNQRPIYPSTYGYPTGYKICAGCNNEIGYDFRFDRMGAVWHPRCFRRHDSAKPISEHKVTPPALATPATSKRLRRTSRADHTPTATPPTLASTSRAPPPTLQSTSRAQKIPLATPPVPPSTSRASETPLATPQAPASPPTAASTSRGKGKAKGKAVSKKVRGNQ